MYCNSFHPSTAVLSTWSTNCTFLKFKSCHFTFLTLYYIMGILPGSDFLFPAMRLHPTSFSNRLPGDVKEPHTLYLQPISWPIYQNTSVPSAQHFPFSCPSMLEACEQIIYPFVLQTLRYLFLSLPRSLINILTWQNYNLCSKRILIHHMDHVEVKQQLHWQETDIL